MVFVDFLGLFYWVEILMVRLFEEVPVCLLQPETLVGKSNNSIVVGYKQKKILLKCDRKSMQRVYPDLITAFTYIGREQQDRKLIRELLQKTCRSANIIPPVDVVIHNGEDGSICYSEVQEWFQDGKTLAQTGWKVIYAKAGVIHDLRVIFSKSIQHYLETGDVIDIQGTVRGLDGIQKILAAFIPLFSSTNLIIHNDQVLFIDANMLVGKKLPLRTVIHRQIKMLGAVISVALLHTILLGRKLKEFAAGITLLK